jgi:hypothetical protein
MAEMNDRVTKKNSKTINSTLSHVHRSLGIKFLNKSEKKG